MERDGFAIPLNGLAHEKWKSGLHVGKEFFEKFGNTEISDASLQVTLEAWKSGSSVLVDCLAEGSISVPCDRCLDLVSIPVDVSAGLRIRFGNVSGDDKEEDDGEREVVTLEEAVPEYDMSQVVYDYVCLSLPARRMHPEGGCNKEMLGYLKSGITLPGGDGGSEKSPFSVLNGIFNS